MTRAPTFRLMVATGFRDPHEAIGYQERSPHWVWGAIDPITKLLLALDSGDRTLEMAQRLVQRVAEVSCVSAARHAPFHGQASRGSSRPYGR